MSNEKRSLAVVTLSDRVSFRNRPVAPNVQPRDRRYSNLTQKDGTETMKTSVYYLCSSGYKDRSNFSDATKSKSE